MNKNQDLDQSLKYNRRKVSRIVTSGKHTWESTIGISKQTGDQWADWWKSFILGNPVVSESGLGRTVSVIDLFGSAGGLSLGVNQALVATGRRMKALAAVDLDVDALATYQANFNPITTINESVTSLIDYQLVGKGEARKFAYRPTPLRAFEGIGSVDLLIGGPPCQGHSTLNNRTRGKDSRNDLYLTMPALAFALNAKAVIIENVPRVVHDSGRVVQTTEQIFLDAGYFVSSGVLSASSLGWPQTRSRHFMIASKVRQPIDILELGKKFARETLSLRWLIEDLELSFMNRHELLDTVPNLSKDNVRRINWLFDNDAYNLIDSERPICHQNGHTYPSVYGRLNYDRPSQTLSTGFQTPGRGRHVHPSQRRVLTLREAARIQGFPDNFKYVNADGNHASRGNMQKWIGDAVPSILGFTAGLAAVDSMI